jgi:peptidyl-prolyl cis-trans isomerase C
MTIEMPRIRACLRLVLSLAALASPLAHAADGAQTYADDTPVLKHGETVITLGDVRRSVAQTIPPDRTRRFYAERKLITQHAGSFFVVRKLAEEAQARELTADERFRAEEARMRALSQVQLDHIVAQEKQPDYEAVAREEWQAHPEKFQGPEAVQVSHILVKSGEARSDAEALARAEEALAKAKAGADFAALAGEYSEDPSVAQNKGDMGFFQRGQMVKPFEDAAFALTKKGDFTGPVKTEFGYHVLRFEGRREAGVLPFAEVRERLIAKHQSEFRTRIVNREIERIGALDGVETNYDALISLYQPVDFGQPKDGQPKDGKGKATPDKTR